MTISLKKARLVPVPTEAPREEDRKLQVEEEKVCMTSGTSPTPLKTVFSFGR